MGNKQTLKGAVGNANTNIDVEFILKWFKH